ncbi:MAG: IPT/TIG domain-containing protein [Planctomycetales bacterium]|nr:IPT/TIG domain-containing protein [Planctomycetales bacterium]
MRTAHLPPGPGALILAAIVMAVAGSGCQKERHRPLPVAEPSPPLVASVAPSSGPTTGGTSVTVSGDFFQAGASVLFGSSAASATVASATTIVATTPPGTAGAVSVTVLNPDGRSASLAGAFTYLLSPPSFSSVSPAFGLDSGGTSVTVSGSAFQSGATVAFGGSPLSSVALVNANTITGVTAAHPIGRVTVTVTNPDTQSASLPNGFLYTAVPTVSAIAPGTGLDAGGDAVTITGSSFAPGATADLGGTALASVSVVSSTQIVGVTAAHAPAVVDVRVTNPGPNPGALTQGFRYVYPPNRQTTQFTWDTSTGINHTRRWLVDANWAAFLSDLQARGLQTGTASDPVNAYALDWMRAYILQGLNVAYGRNSDGTRVSGTSIHITFVGIAPATGSPGGTNATTDYSRMCIGGTSSSGAGVLGTAWFDSGSPCGNSSEDDCLGSQFGGSGGTLGVFSASVPTTALSPALSQADQPNLDGSVTSGTRYNDIHARLLQYAQRLAYIASHEIGHSVGLTGSALTGSCGGASQCGASGAHNSCCTTNVMKDVASFSGLTSFTSRAFSGHGVSAATTCYTNGLSSWAMLQSYLGVSP